jgi:hypothetical protein
VTDEWDFGSGIKGPRRKAIDAYVQEVADRKAAMTPEERRVFHALGGDDTEPDPITAQANVLLARIAAAKAEPREGPPSAQDLIGAGMDHSSPLYCAASAIVAALDRLARAVERRNAETCDGSAVNDAGNGSYACTRPRGHAGECG